MRKYQERIIHGRWARRRDGDLAIINPDDNPCASTVALPKLPRGRHTTSESFSEDSVHQSHTHTHHHTINIHNKERVKVHVRGIAHYSQEENFEFLGMEQRCEKGCPAPIEEEDDELRRLSLTTIDDGRRLSTITLNDDEEDTWGEWFDLEDRDSLMDGMQVQKVGAKRRAKRRSRRRRKKRKSTGGKAPRKQLAAAAPDNDKSILFMKSDKSISDGFGGGGDKLGYPYLKSTGGKAPRKQLALAAPDKTIGGGDNIFGGDTFAAYEAHRRRR